VVRIPKDVVKTRDITGGLPRISELLEARAPKDPAIISDIDGYVSFGKEQKSKRRVIILSEKGDKKIDYLVSKGRYIIVHEGDYVKKGEVIVDGNVVLSDILRVLGVEQMAIYIINEIQRVYRLQGVPINDKHIELIVKQMMKKHEILDPGDSGFISGDEIDKFDLLETNKRLEEDGKKPIQSRPILQGITKASLHTKSFISAASFQETTRVLTEAAISGKIDYLKGLKENVIVGRLMPSGTGSIISKWKKKVGEGEPSDTNPIKPKAAEKRKKKKSEKAVAVSG
jgi:DNA-directed RNA polymerase subunit beta'